MIPNDKCYILENGGSSWLETPGYDMRHGAMHPISGGYMALGLAPGYIYVGICRLYNKICLQRSNLQKTGRWRLGIRFLSSFSIWKHLCWSFSKSTQF